MTFRLFLGYRRDDTGYVTGRLFDRLAATFGRESIFVDIDNIPVGYDFSQFLRDAVSSCQLMILMMGRDWLGNSAGQSGERRIDRPLDYLRLEIELALKQNVRILTVLVDNASFPRREELPVSIQHIVNEPTISLNSERFDLDYPMLEDKVRALAEITASAGADLENQAAVKAASNRNSEYFFISYAREDIDFTRRLATGLHAEGILVWMDELHMKMGRAWEDQVEVALRDAAAIIFIMSRVSIEADTVRDELSLAVDLKKPVLPVRIDECEPPLRLRRLQYADFVRPFDVAFRKFVFDVKESIHTAITSPEEAMRKGFNTGLLQVATVGGSNGRTKERGTWRKWLSWTGLQ